MTVPFAGHDILDIYSPNKTVTIMPILRTPVDMRSIMEEAPLRVAPAGVGAVVTVRVLLTF